MRKEKLDALFISSVPNIIYLTGFSGFSKEDRDAFLLITKNKQYIYTHGIYKDATEKFIKDFELVEMKRENPISKSLKYLIEKHKINKLGVEEFDLRVNEYQNLLKHLNKKTIRPAILVNELRKIKFADEIEKIKNSCDLGDKTYTHILKFLKVNISEKDLAYEIESFIRKKGAEPSFPTIVAFAENAAYPHHIPTEKKLEKSMFILMDFGVKLDDYCSDMTRTVFFGKANDEQKKVYNTVLSAQQKAIELFNNLTIKQSGSKKIKTSIIDKVARDHITRQGFPTIPHSLGHGIGLEVHEEPRLSPLADEILKNGMVFSVEPGIYLSETFGVRIEDLFAIENGRLTQLTKSTKELIEI